MKRSLLCLACLLAACVPSQTDNSLLSLIGFSAGDASFSVPDVPYVSWVAPGMDASSVAINTGITIGFTKEMKASTLNESTFVVRNGAVAVEGSYQASGRVFVFHPLTDLAANTTYTVEVTTGARGVSGDSLNAAFQWTFTTGNGSDATAPTIVNVSPSSGAVGVAANRSFTALFSEPLDGTTVTTSSFTLKKGGVPVAGSVSYGFNQATFTPAARLDYSSEYTLTLTSDIKDLAGNALASVTSWSFTTGAAPDNTPPAVLSVTPADGAVDVSIHPSISVTLDEPLNSDTVTSSTVLLSQGGIAVPGTIAYSGTTITFTPAFALSNSKVYRMTLQPVIKDLAGNALGTQYNWYFTTEAAQPTVKTVLSSLSYRDLDDSRLSRYSAFAYSDEGYTVTMTQYTGTHTSSGGNLYATVVVRFENPSGRLLSISRDVVVGSMQDSYTSYDYEPTGGALISITYRETGASSSAPIFRVASAHYDTSGQVLCWRSADSGGVTDSVLKFVWNSGLPSSMSAFSSGSCSSPSGLTSSAIYQFDGSGRPQCNVSEVFQPVTSKNVEQFSGYDAQGLAAQQRYYSAGTCSSPTSLNLTVNYGREYSSNLMTCESRNRSGSITDGRVLQFALSGGLFNTVTRSLNAGSGSCAASGSTKSITSMTTTTLLTSNSSIDASAWMNPVNSGAAQSVKLLRAMGDSGTGLLYATGPSGDGASSYAPQNPLFGPRLRNVSYGSDYTTYDETSDLTWTTCALGKTGSTCSGGTAQTFAFCPSATHACDDGTLLESGSLFDACDALNQLHSGAGYGGKTGWRLPTGQDYERTPVDRIAFPNPLTGSYWTASVDSSNGMERASVMVYSPYSVADRYDISDALKTQALMVRCVAPGN